MTPRCEDCAYWVSVRYGNPPGGTCRASPPALLSPDDDYGRWPMTEPDDWCSHWSAPPVVHFTGEIGPKAAEALGKAWAEARKTGHI